MTTEQVFSIRDRMETLTSKQTRILEFIREQISQRGCPPSMREIGRAFRIASTNGVWCHLQALAKKGYIDLHTNSARGIRLSAEFREHSGLPMVGHVAAGTPILAEQNIEQYVSPDSLVRTEPGCFVLRVQGDSMKDAGILDGDFVVVRPTPDFENNAIGVAILDGEATVKRLRRRGRLIELIPANEAYEKVSVDPSEIDFRFAGEVTDVHRKLK